jgi:hypothetical protein
MIMEILEIIFQLFGESPSLGIFIGALLTIATIVSLFYFLS